MNDGSRWESLTRTAWCGVAVAWLSVIVFASPGDASAQPLTISLRQTTPNPVQTRVAVSYTLTVRNEGRVNYPSVQALASFPGSGWGLPANGVGPGCSYAGGGGAPTARVTCNVGGLAPGASRVMTFQILAPPGVANASSQPFTITAGLDVNATLPGTGGADAISSVVTQVYALPDLDPDWSGPLAVTAGREAAYRLRVRNTGSGQATAVVARITLPREVDYVRLEDSSFRSCSRAGQEITCSEILIAPGREASVSVVVRPLQLVANGTRLLMGASVDPSNTVRESRETNNTAFITPTVSAGTDLQVTGRLEIFDFLIPGDRSLRALSCETMPGRRTTTAHLTVRNNGPGQSPATSVRVNWLVGADLGNAQCPSGYCCVDGSCLARGATGCPPRFFDAASVPSLAPGSSYSLRARAVTLIPGAGRFQVEWGTVTLDPDNRVNDPNRQNNSWTMRP